MSSTISLDNSSNWTTIAKGVVGWGALHATLGQKPASQKKLTQMVVSHFGTVNGRNGHWRMLRTAYGAAYNGIALTRRAQALGGGSNV